MISRKNRFHGYGSLKYVYQHGQTVRSMDMALKFVANEKRKSYRLAVVVSKKVHKSAVKRNRIRRRLYELMRTKLSSVTGTDIVLTVFSDKLLIAEPTELDQKLSKLLQQAKII